MCIFGILLYLMFQPIEYIPDLGSPVFNTRVKAAQSLHALNDICIVGMHFLTKNPDAEISSLAEQNLKWRVDTLKRKEIKNKLKQLKSVIPEPGSYCGEDKFQEAYAAYMRLYKEDMTKNTFRGIFYSISNEDIYNNKLYIYGMLYELEIIDIIKMITSMKSFYLQDGFSEYYNLNKQQSFFFQEVDILIYREGAIHKFWISLEDIVNKDLFFTKEYNELNRQK